MESYSDLETIFEKLLEEKPQKEKPMEAYERRRRYEQNARLYSQQKEQLKRNKI